MPRNPRTRMRNNYRGRIHHHPYNNHNNFHRPTNWNNLGKNTPQWYSFQPRFRPRDQVQNRPINSHRTAENTGGQNRSPSPFFGSEEHTQKKIQETSDMIKRQLMSPDFTIPVCVSAPLILPEENDEIGESNQSSISRDEARKEKFKTNSSTTEPKKVTYNVQEIHNQIVGHISKLNHARKQNLINADSTEFDCVLQQIYKQKSLELSKALRDMSCQEKPQASDVVNAIIPDFAIKFEELPVDVIRELSSTFENVERNIPPTEVLNENYFIFSDTFDNNIPNDSLSNEIENFNLCVKSEPVNSYEQEEGISNLLDSPAVSPNPCLILENSAINSTSDVCSGDILSNFNGNGNLIEETCTIPVGNVDNSIRSVFDSHQNHTHELMDVERRSLSTEAVASEDNSSSSHTCDMIPNENICNKIEESICVKSEPDNTAEQEEEMRNCMDSPDSIQFSFLEALRNQRTTCPEHLQAHSKNVNNGESSGICDGDIHSSSNGIEETCHNSVGNSELNLTGVSSDSHETLIQQAKYKYFSMKIEHLNKPNNLKEAVEMMLEVDKAIEELTSIRQKTILKFSGCHETTILIQHDQTFDNLVETNDKLEKKKSQNIKLTENIGNVEVCLRVPGTEILIAGTTDGKLLYFNLVNMKIDSNFQIGSCTPINSLEYFNVGQENLIIAAKYAEPYLYTFKFKKVFAEKILLSDRVQKIEKDERYIFIGGSNGYLTRFNCSSAKIEFEDRISEMAIADLKISKEGVRKILIILFADSNGNTEIHVRDCMSALFIRNIGSSSCVRSIFLHNSLVYALENNITRKYNFCTGNFINETRRSRTIHVSKLRQDGKSSLFVIQDATNDNIFIFNVKDKHLMGPLDCSTPASIVIADEQLIFFSKSNKSIEVVDFENFVEESRRESKLPSMCSLQKLFE